LNCPIDENEYNDVVSDSISDNQSTSITIDKNGVQIKEQNKEVDSRDFKGLEINDKGIIIKTN